MADDVVLHPLDPPQDATVYNLQTYFIEAAVTATCTASVSMVVIPAEAEEVPGGGGVWFVQPIPVDWRKIDEEEALLALVLLEA